MTRFLDGPAEGVTLELRRLPVYLRAVFSTAGLIEWDALDQLDDACDPVETPVAYRKVPGSESALHVDGVDKRGRRFGRWYRGADYRVVADQPPEEIMRDNGRWREWCQERYLAEQETTDEGLPEGSRPV